MLKRYFSPLYISLFLALLFHICGAAGILWSEHTQWFINASPVTLLLMGLLLFITQKQKNSYYIVFILLCIFTGMITEITGVNTGYLFGSYSYGKVLGPQVLGVPWLIGINWFIAVYCAGVTTHYFEKWILQQAGADAQLPTGIQHISFIIDTALLAAFFDWLLEPVAIKLGYWNWENNSIPFYNYLCWFIISAILAGAMRFLSFDKENRFAVHLFIIQSLFFLLLRSFL